MKKLLILIMIFFSFKHNALDAMQDQEYQNTINKKTHLRYGICLFGIGTLSVATDIYYENNNPMAAFINTTLLLTGVRAIYKSYQLENTVPTENQIESKEIVTKKYNF